MNPDLARADRWQAVRDDARGWHRAGAIDDAALAAVERRYPDDRRRVAPAFRGLLIAFTTLALAGAVVLTLEIVGASGTAKAASESLITLLAGLAFAVAADVQLGALRRRQGGIEAATSFVALGCLLTSMVSALDYPLQDAKLPVAAVLLAAAAWRWGYPLYAAASGVALFLAAMPLPQPRALWVVASLAAALPLLAAAESPRLPPAHRASATALLLVAVTALYVAVNLVSWDEQWIENYAARGSASVVRPARDLLHWLAAAATALLPIALLALGIRRRRVAILLAGIAAVVASLATLRQYVHILPLWAALVAGGTLLAAAAIACQRYLASGPDGERRGLTAAPLFAATARERLLESAAAIVAFTPAATPADHDPGAGFTGDGGRSGGAGATTEF